MPSTDTNADTPADSSPWRNWARWLAPLLSVAVFTMVAIVVHRELATHSLKDIALALRSIPTDSIIGAAILTVTSYALLTFYDYLGILYVGKQAAYPRVALTSFIAYAFGHNLGVAAFTGTAVRYRMYSAMGLSTLEVAIVVSFCASTTAVGLGLVGGTALILATPGTTAIHLGHAWSQLVGWIVIGAVLAYLAWASLARRSVFLGSWELRPPRARIALPQALLAVVELSVAAGALWLLMPASAEIDFLTFLGVFAIGVSGGVASQVPGGLGVFEAIVLLAIPRVPAPTLLGTLIAFRVIYYLLPLMIAAVGMLANELFLQRRAIGRTGKTASVWITPLLLPVAPQLLAALVFVAGAVLLVSGATPSVDSRIHLIRAVIPLPLLEVSHLAGSVIGVGLLILARGLMRRQSGAYHITFWLLLAGIVASLLKGFDVEEALFLAIVLALLRLSRPAFYRPSSLLSQRFTPGWLAGVGIIVGLSIWLGMLAYRHVPYDNELWWTFAMRGDAPRMLRASFAVIVVLAGFLAMNLLRPATPDESAGTKIDPLQLRKIIAQSGVSVANAALTGDKRLLLHPAGDALVMYQVSGRSWIALGDPVGPEERREELAWSFRELVDQAGGRAVFYQVTTANLPLYLDLGLSLMKIGEEARVKLTDFSLEGSARADLRQAHRRPERAGATFEILAPEQLDAVLPSLRTISDQWLEEKATAEKGFSLGAFAEDYLRQFPIALVRVAGTPVAFANLWPTASCEELSVDLMRFSPDAPNGTMDYLFVELMLWGKAQGYRWFNLGMAPLSGLETRALAPIWQRLGGFVYRHGEAFYNFEGLRRYKNKFDPEWEPRYLASPRGLQLPAALLDLSTLISGGVRELVAK